MIRQKRAARGSCNYTRALPGSVQNPTSILADYDTATLVAGVLVACSFGFMFIWAAVMW